jgi:hypothetical protein
LRESAGEHQRFGDATRIGGEHLMCTAAFALRRRFRGAETIGNSAYDFSHLTSSSPLAKDAFASSKLSATVAMFRSWKACSSSFLSGAYPDYGRGPASA